VERKHSDDTRGRGGAQLEGISEGMLGHERFVKDS